MEFLIDPGLQDVALLAIHRKGYSIRVDKTMILGHMEKPSILYIAEKPNCYFQASSYVELLGLIELGELRGEEWQLNQSEIEIIRKELNVSRNSGGFHG
jgi:hypothetical protein